MERRKIQWHPAFAAALHIELEEESEDLTFEEEHLLAHKPLQIDVVIIKKTKDKKLKKNIARIFKGHNIIEYKSPDDSLNMNDFYKVTGYACIYQSDTEKVGEIDPEDITVTFVSNAYPRKMLKHLETVRNMKIEKQEKGIYYITGGIFVMQLIVTKELPPEINYWLQNLRKDLKSGGEIEKLIERYEKEKRSPWREAVMDVISRANWKEMEVEKNMCEALKELFADELKEAREYGREEYTAQGIELAKKVFKFAKEDMPISLIAEKCEITEEMVKQILD